MTPEAPIDSPTYNEMLLKFKNREITENEAREFFGEHFEEAKGTIIAMRHIDNADTALNELNEMQF